MPPSPTDIEPFRIEIPDAEIEDLAGRLARTRLPEPLDDVGWDYGMDAATLRTLLDHWRDHYDWRKHETLLNGFPQWKTRIGDLEIHFIHQRSPEPAARPLLLLHGWPGSIFEFHKILGPLTDPVAHGGRAEDAFHVVAPSLPGYGFSSAPRRPGCDIRAVAETMIALMQRLGYARYGAQGGDWGAIASSYVGLLDPEHCMAIHLNMPLAPPPEGSDPTEGLSEKELAALADIRRVMSEETGYQSIQGTRPDTLSVGLTDSPAGLAAWIVEKFRAWSDCGGDVFSRFTRDELLTNVSIYWFTRSIASSVRLYTESRRSGRFGPVEARVDVPTGCAVFPRELFRPPRRWVEARFRVERWTEMPAGGHFAALEEPDALLEDVRAFFRGRA